MRFREQRGMRRRAAWVVRAAADPECHVFVNRGGRFVIIYYCKPNSTLIHTLRDRRGRHGLDTLGCVNALNRLTPLTLGLTTLTPCSRPPSSATASQNAQTPGECRPSSPEPLWPATQKHDVRSVRSSQQVETTLRDHTNLTTHLCPKGGTTDQYTI